MDKKLVRLQDHYIVCGFGRIGKVICKSLAGSNKGLVIIENNPEEIKEIEQKGYMYVDGDAADDEILMKAGVKCAKGLIAVVSSDAENVYITLSAKELNPGLYVMGRTSGKAGAETKLLRAGANKVISPYDIGARQMANILLKPRVAAGGVNCAGDLALCQ
jgi:voltage-gated potassium channel